MNNVKVSVIVLCYNENKYIDRCLESIHAFDPIDGGFEVLVVDGMSVDGTRQRLADWAVKRKDLILLDNPARITPVAMNLGIRASRGEFIIFLSAHVEYAHDLLARLMSTYERVEADNVGGILVTLAGDASLQAQLVQAVTTHRFGVGNAEFRVGAKEGYVDAVVYGCYRRSVFDRIGLHDERLVRNQDYEINSRLIKAGGRIWQDPAICSRYYNQSTIRGLLVQAWANGKWNPWMWYLAPYSFALRHTIPGVFVAALIFSLVMAGAFPWGWVFLASIFAPYTLLALVSAARQSSRYSWKLFPFLPFVFLLYHLAYGAGILWGLLQLVFKKAPVQGSSEPWQGAGRTRAWQRVKGRRD